LCSFEFCFSADVQCNGWEYNIGNYFVNDGKLVPRLQGPYPALALSCSGGDLSTAAIGRPPVGSPSNRNWSKIFWGSNESCREGINDPRITWDSRQNVSCCATRTQTACNAPDSKPPTIKCFTTRASIAAGFCAGKTIENSVCAAGQGTADARAAIFTEVIPLTKVFRHEIAELIRPSSGGKPSQDIFGLWKLYGRQKRLLHIYRRHGAMNPPYTPH
jgi:hypothetical protein